jgi:hypothetical protein
VVNSSPSLAELPLQSTGSSADFPDQLAAQRFWIAYLRGDADRGREPLTNRQWACVADEAARHQLRGLTYRLLADDPVHDRIPPETGERLRSWYLEAAMRNALLFRQTGQMVGQLVASGIPVMLLKGVHLSRFVYAEPALRSMADVDLMVPREDLARTEQIFLDRGFGPQPRPNLEDFCTWSNHLAKLEKQDAPVVELHWSIERPSSPFRIDLDGLWARSEAATFEGAPVHLLSAEDLLLHLALHGSYHHRFDRSALKGLVDIHAVVARQGNDINWQMLADRANAWGASGYAYTTFRVASEVLGTPFPQALWGALPHQPADDDVVDVVRRYILMPRLEMPKVYVKLAQTRTVRERSSLLFRSVFLSREEMEGVYQLRPGTPLVYAYYGLRLGSLLMKRSPLLLGASSPTRGMRSTVDRENARLRIERWVKDRNEPGRLG